MNILHLSDRASARGGADGHLCSVIDALADDHDQHLLVGRDDKTGHFACPVQLVPGLDDIEQGPETGLLDKHIELLKPDIVHVHNAIGPGTLDWARQRGAIVTVHDHRPFCPGRGKLTLAGKPCTTTLSPQACRDCFDNDTYAQQMTGASLSRLEALKAMKAVTVVSHYMKRELLAAGLDERRVFVTPPFVHDLEPNAKANGPPCALFAGRLVDTKGPSVALEAWRRARLDGLELIMAGTGAMRPALEARGCTVLGWVNRQQMAALYRRAAVLIMPSMWQEPFGLVGLEALTMGVPVAAWRSGGVPEWHPGGPGLAPWGDVDGLAEAIVAVAGTTPPPPHGFDRHSFILQIDKIYRSMQNA